MDPIRAAREAELIKVIRPFQTAHYTIDMHFPDIEAALGNYEKSYGLNLDPDFQRGHVWTMEQRTSYIEYLVRGGQAARDIQFNCPSWENTNAASDLPAEMQIIDGKQRLETVRMYMRREIQPFGLSHSDLYGTTWDPSRVAFSLRASVHAITSRAELLTLYLGFNEGGTPHGKAELDRVRALLEATPALVMPPPDTALPAPAAQARARTSPRPS